MNVNIKKKIKPITLFLLALIFNNYLSHSSYAAEITEDVSNIQYNIDPIIRDLLRVRSVGYRLAKANSGRCAIPTMQTGLIVHDIGGFSEFDRAAAMRDYGLTYGFGIIAVVEGSPAMRAGARVGDEIVGINGQDLSRFAKEAVKRKASYDRVEAFEDFLQIALLERDIILRVKRAGQYLDLPLESERGCGGRFTNLRTKRLNAWSNGKYVTVSTSMMQFAEDDGELAFIMAHEMAHNILAHNGAERSEVGLLPDRSTKAGGRQAREFQADVFAIEIIRDAGYDPYCVPLLFARIGKRTSQAFALSHPNIKRRMAAVAIEIRESSKRRHFVTQIHRPEGVEVREADPLAFQTRIRDEILNEDKRYYSDASFNLPSLSRWASSSGTVGLTSLSRDRRGPSFDSKMDTSKNRWISARW